MPGHADRSDGIRDGTCWAYSDADSGEFERRLQDHKVIDFMPDQYGDIPKGGTMRLGAYPCTITAGTIMERAYGTGLRSQNDTDTDTSSTTTTAKDSTDGRNEDRRYIA